MHEFSLIADLMKKIYVIAHRENAERIVSVRVQLGALSHISPDHFRRHFVIAAHGTPANGARLEIEVSSDVSDTNAQDILLKSVEVEAQ